MNMICLILETSAISLENKIRSSTQLLHICCFQQIEYKKIIFPGNCFYNPWK